MEKEKTNKIILEELKKDFPRNSIKNVSYGKRSFYTIDAYHIIERLTEVFGLCGYGWGVEVKEYKETRYEKEYKETQYETTNRSNKVKIGYNIACIGKFWYDLEHREKYFIEATGDAEVINYNFAEAYKKAYTNLISKASSYLLVGHTVYKGQYLDDPYRDRAQATEETQTQKLRAITKKDDWETKKENANFQVPDDTEFWEAKKRKEAEAMKEKITEAGYSEKKNNSSKDWEDYI